MILQKILVAVFAFAGNFIIQWYGNFSGKLPSKGEYLGIQFDSVFVRAVITQLEYIWVLILINIFFTLMFSVGFASFKNFLTLALIWFAMGPISALVFNTFVLKERVSLPAFLGIILVIAGSILIVAQKEILAFFKK